MKIKAENYPTLHRLVTACALELFDDASYTSDEYDLPAATREELDQAEATAAGLPPEDWATLVSATGDRYIDLFISCSADPAYSALDDLLGAVLQ